MFTIAYYSLFFTQPSKWSFKSWATKWHAPLWTLYSLPLHLEWNTWMTWQAPNTSPAMPCSPRPSTPQPMLACHQFLNTCKLFLMSESSYMLFPLLLRSSLHFSAPCPYFSTHSIPIFCISTPSFYFSLISQLKSIFICLKGKLCPCFLSTSPTKLNIL